MAINEIKDQDFVTRNIEKSTNNSGQKMGVPIKKNRFPLWEGFQQKITLRSSQTGTFMNIGFMAGVDNEINGNIADNILDHWPSLFSVIKINGKIVQEGAKESERSIIEKEIMRKLKEEFELKPRVDTKRQRMAQSQIAKNEVPSEVVKENKFKVDTEPIKGNAVVTKKEDKTDTKK